jgi:hypothetical protein
VSAKISTGLSAGCLPNNYSVQQLFELTIISICSYKSKPLDLIRGLYARKYIVIFCIEID